jgi:hypothetical protein
MGTAPELLELDELPPELEEVPELLEEWLPDELPELEPLPEPLELPLLELGPLLLPPPSVLTFNAVDKSDRWGGVALSNDATW